MATRDIKQFGDDLRKKADQVARLRKKVPGIIAGAAEKMKDANFSAEGFVVGGSARPKWKKRKKETRLTQGRRILSGTGYLQNNVKVKASPTQVSVGADLSKVPYARLHNEGGRVTQYVRAHHRKNPKTGKRYQVRAHSRRITMPQRKFLGYSPDIHKIAKRELDYEYKKILK